MAKSLHEESKLSFKEKGINPDAYILKIYKWVIKSICINSNVTGNHHHFPDTINTCPWITGNRYLTWARKTLAIHSIWVCKLSQHRCLQSKMYVHINPNVHSPVYLVTKGSEIPTVSLMDGLSQSKWEYLSTGCLEYDVRIIVYQCHFKQNIAKVLIIAERQSAIFFGKAERSISFAFSGVRW